MYKHVILFICIINLHIRALNSNLNFKLSDAFSQIESKHYNSITIYYRYSRSIGGHAYSLLYCPAIYMYNINKN